MVTGSLYQPPSYYSLTRVRLRRTCIVPKALAWQVTAFRIAELEQRVVQLNRDVQAARKDRDDVNFRYDQFKLAVEQGKRISRRDHKDAAHGEVEELRRRVRELEGHNEDLQARLQLAFEEEETFQGECLRDVRDRVHSKMFAGETLERAEMRERKSWFGRWVCVAVSADSRPRRKGGLSIMDMLPA
ncbi:uncharacterized protein LOC62_05G007555 [Vanrija pseudolonga]|uniref:Uncharacterized protein n=1 Tax=Vanrija pseudolonga TaxID=143232 RepID=A0AAF0YC47_9TREE|nr:hypothetical protein LOC62_05G007555 [Vanrija pseudolonga]